MALTVKVITLWRRELPNRAGALAEVLDPLARAGVDLQLAMGYRYPGNEQQAAVELAPVKGRKAESAARAAGLAPSEIPTLFVQGDNRPGVGSAISRSLADAGISMAFLVAQVIGRQFTMVVGFESDSDARNAAGLIRKAAGRRPGGRARAGGARRPAPRRR